MNLPKTREEYTQLALTHQFDPKVDSLYGEIIDDGNFESDEEMSRAFWAFVHWIGKTIQDFPDLVEHCWEHEQHDSGRVLVWIAGVFVCVFCPDKIKERIQDLRDEGKPYESFETLLHVFQAIVERSGTRNYDCNS